MGSGIPIRAAHTYMSGNKEKRLRLVIFLVISSIITISIIAFFYSQRVRNTSSQISSTKDVMLSLNDLYNTLIYHAGIVRDYSMTGKKEDSINVYASSTILRKKFNELKNKFQSDTAKSRLTDSLEKYISKRIEFSHMITAEGAKSGLPTAEKIYQTGIGREYNNLVFSFINDIQAKELETLQLTEKKNSFAGNKLSFFIIGLLGFIFILAVFIIQKLRLDRAEAKNHSEQLKGFNEMLEKQVQLKTQEKEHVNYLQNERIRELTTLHKVSQLLQSENISDAQLLQKIVTIIPGGWQHPDKAATRITWGNEIFESDNYLTGPQKQSARFQSFDGKTGTIDLVYLEEMAAEVEEPFLQEERNMLNTLAEMLEAYFDRKLAEERLHQSYQEIRQLASYIETAREDEKIRIAREIHDDLGQQLTGLKMDLSWLAQKLSSNGTNLHGKIEEMKGLLDEIVGSVRRISSDLRPGILDDLGLVAAIKWQSREFQKRSGINTQFHSSSSELNLPSNLSTGLFRIFQESLTNVARHSKAHQVTASLDKVGNNLILKISDDGIGFNVSNIGKKRTLGLLGMKERTALMGGQYEIVSEEGSGTSVKVSVPI
jgi:signal transduction histidine kinase/CHASE3 domain sensor protein